MSKVANIYQQKHNSVINEYLDILKKDIKRKKRLKAVKDDFDYKNKIENEKRDLLLVNFKNKKKYLEKDLLNRYAKKYKKISDFAEEQKEIKNSIIKNRQKDRNEKIEKNIFIFFNSICFIFILALLFFYFIHNII